MSTKSTIAYGSNFHLYNEALDEDYVYLAMEGVQFEAGYNRVMVPIPMHIWEYIRQFSGIDLAWIERTDDELQKYVGAEVDERVKRYNQTDDKGRRLVRIFGSLVYGAADEPKEKQIAAGVGYYMRVREHQRQIAAAIKDLERKAANE